MATRCPDLADSPPRPSRPAFGPEANRLQDSEAASLTELRSFAAAAGQPDLAEGDALLRRIRAGDPEAFPEGLSGPEIAARTRGMAMFRPLPRQPRPRATWAVSAAVAVAAVIPSSRLQNSPCSKHWRDETRRPRCR